MNDDTVRKILDALEKIENAIQEPNMHRGTYAAVKDFFTADEPVVARAWIFAEMGSFCRKSEIDDALDVMIEGYLIEVSADKSVTGEAVNIVYKWVGPFSDD